MKRILFSFLALILTLVACRFFIPKPPLLEGISFSQAIYADNHQLMRLKLSADEKFRFYVPLREISPLLIQTTLFQEDHYFYYHPGFNPAALAKALWQTYVVHKRQFGSSTITMQVAKMRYRIYTKSISGKLWQMLKAFQLEMYYSKDEILEAYLNLASYGGNIEGIGAASLIYFAKPAHQLNLAEALRLTVIPQNPLRRAPVIADQENLQRGYTKLYQRWLKEHPEDQDKEHLIQTPFEPNKKNLPFHAPHFVDSLPQGNQSLITTLNLDLQTLLEKITCQYLEKHQIEGLRQTAVMLVEFPSMEIKSLIGSGNYLNCQVNGTQAKRSPGSSLKPFIYALALDQGIIHPYTILKDEPCTFVDYHPENFDQDYLGSLKAKEALILSRNIPAITLTQQLKEPTLYQFLEKANVTRLKSEEHYGLSLALGGAELTMEELVCLYGMLANYGLWKPLRSYQGESLTEEKRLLSPEASFLTLDMLRDTPRPFAVNKAMKQQLSVYWKTGTSSGYRDAWSIGIFGPYVLAVWIGDFENKTHAYVGVKVAAPLFFHIVEAIQQNMGQLPDLIQLTPNMNLTKVNVCEASGFLPNPHCPRTTPTWFIPGKSPIKTDDIVHLK